MSSPRKQGIKVQLWLATKTCDASWNLRQIAFSMRMYIQKQQSHIFIRVPKEARKKASRFGRDCHLHRGAISWLVPSDDNWNNSTVCRGFSKQLWGNSCGDKEGAELKRWKAKFVDITHPPPRPLLFFFRRSDNRPISILDWATKKVERKEDP